MPKVSVIIPVYGAERYIERCVRSLFEQTLDDIEYIFVDDCTPDKSMEVLKRVAAEYPDRDGQIKVLRTPKNSGQHVARQMGIEASTGDYVTHCDPDDAYTTTSALELAYDTIFEKKADIVWWDIQLEREDLSCVDLIQSCEEDSINVLKKFLTDPTFMGSLCNKLVRRDIVHLHSIIRPQAPIIEDLVYVFQYTMNAEKLVYLKQPLYKYRRHKESTTASIKPIEKIKADIYKIKTNADIIISLVENHHKLKALLKDELLRFKWYIKDKTVPIILHDKDLSTWKTIYPEIHGQIIFNSVFSTREKIMSLAIMSGVFNLYH